MRSAARCLRARLRQRPLRRAPCLWLGLSLSLSQSGCFEGPRYRGPRSDHFDGTRFHDGKDHAVGFWDLLRWRLHRERSADGWPERLPPEQTPPGPTPPQRVAAGRLRVTFINHATMLVQLDGFNVLTDPIYSERASPLAGSSIGPRRVRPPGVPFEQLPPIDLVLLSHNHYDHLDLPTLRRLWARDRPRVLCGLGNRALLVGGGLPDPSGQRVQDLDWWQQTAVGALRVTSVPNQHGSRRGALDGDQTLWTAFVVESPHAGAFYFAGDTGYGAHFRAVAQRFPDLRLALLPIGAFRPRWFMHPQHMSPLEAVQAHKDLGAHTSVAMHFGTFDLADDAMDEPVRVLRQRLSQEPALEEQFHALGFGEGLDVP